MPDTTDAAAPTAFCDAEAEAEALRMVAEGLPHAPGRRGSDSDMAALLKERMELSMSGPGAGASSAMVGVDVE